MSGMPLFSADDLPIGMTDLEERMRAEGGVAVRDEAVAALEAAMDRIHADINAGMGQEDFQKAGKIREALAVSRAILLAYPAKT